jgi:hypothetical protein
MPTLAEAIAEVTGLFTSLGLEPLIAVGAIIGAAGLLTRRVMRAVR